MEMRRRSGRAVAERFILTPSSDSKTGASIMLLADHPLFATPKGDETDGKDGEEGETTFSLGLTEKQRRDREGIVLPYFDAQTEVGGGEGGRILYDMGREDDFDEEEDEI
jgi:elongator complex protein 5